MKNPPLKADLHIHTNHSSDSNLSPEKILSVAQRLGLDVVGVVDHLTGEGGRKTLELSRKNKAKVLVIPGQEVRTMQGEVLVYGLEEDLKNFLPLGKTLREASEREALVIIPHPFDRFRSGTGSLPHTLIRMVDAVEVFNARSLMNRDNKRAFEFAQNHGLSMISASDAHFPEEIGKSHTLIYSGKSRSSVFNAVRKGKTELVTKRQSRTSRFKRGLKRIRAYIPSEQY